LNTQGIEAKEVRTKFEGELGEMAEGNTEAVADASATDELTNKR
jgi:hypothetical protein